MQIAVAAENGGGGAHMGEVVLSRAFFIFWVPSTRPQLTLRGVDFRSMHQKCVSVVGVFLWVGLPRESNLPPFAPKTIFQWCE